ncbi:MAG: hypothetical protein JNK63_08765 [Chthonomonas sp.]|nr:hypothetical protein [Chthonomonas sp.]
MPQELIPDWTPHEGQREFLETDARYRVLACGRRWGKTDACAAAIILEVLNSGASKQLILAPTLIQAEILFDRVVEFAEMLFPGELKVRRTPYPSLRVGDHKVWARSGHVGRTLRGQGATHVIVDEAAYVPEELITEIALPMLATTHGRLTLLSTPFGKNHFWRLFRRGLDGFPDFWSKTAPSWESPYVSADFLALQQELISERAYAVEYGAEFMDSAGAVFLTEEIEAATLRELPVLEVDKVSIGVDFGKYDDYTAVVVVQGDRDGANVIHCEKHRRENWQSLVQRIADVVNRYPTARVICDETGTGDAVMALLQPLMPKQCLEGLVFTPTTKVDLIDSLSMMFNRRTLHMTPNLDLLRELQHFEVTHRSSGRLKMEAVGGYHDDLVIALALAVKGLVAPYHLVIAADGKRNFHETQPIQSQTQTYSTSRP